MRMSPKGWKTGHSLQTSFMDDPYLHCVRSASSSGLEEVNRNSLNELMDNLDVSFENNLQFAGDEGFKMIF